MAFKSDIEIAQENELAKITEIAKKIGIGEDHLELYGNYKAKVSADIWEKIKDNKDADIGDGYNTPSGRRRKNDHHCGIG